MNRDNQDPIVGNGGLAASPQVLLTIAERRHTVVHPGNRSMYSLPLELLNEILFCLPLRCAVRTVVDGSGGALGIWGHGETSSQAQGRGCVWESAGTGEEASANIGGGGDIG
jgi:hypothetical protein